MSAAFYGAKADTLIIKWAEKTYIAETTELDEAIDYSKKAMALDHSNPRHHFTSAEIYEWRAFLQRKSPGYWQTNISSALVNYEWLTANLPASAYAWISNAESRLDVGKLDVTIIDYVGHANELGPWDPPVLRRTIHMGIKNWKNLPEYLRVQTRAAVVRVMTMPRYHTVLLDEFVYKTALVYKWDKQLLDLLLTDKQREKFSRIKAG